MSTPITTASSALPAGTRLGEFEITGVVGEGGFGIVYTARDVTLDRIVAIKEYLPAAFAFRSGRGTIELRSPEHEKTFQAGLSSFLNEARLLARFSHPGLVEVYRFWEDNGTAYMAMRYYRGVTLREMIRSHPEVITEEWLRQTLDPILLALRELHAEQCYHRDVAPDNIMVLPNGRSVLMDFGAARRIIGGMTRALTTVLKPGYAPIEQYSDDGSMAQGAWTDIYAIGGVLYHAMTGKVPVQAISRMMVDPLKDVATLARGPYSERLCQAVMKCLAVMPEQRFQSIDELRAALGWSGQTEIQSLTTTVVPPVGTVARPSESVRAPATTPTASAPVAEDDRTPTVVLTGEGSRAPTVSRSEDPLADLLKTAAPVEVAVSSDAAPAPTPASAAPAQAPTGRSAKRRPILVAGLALTLLAILGGTFYALTSTRLGQTQQPPATAAATAPGVKPATEAPPASAPEANRSTAEAPSPTSTVRVESAAASTGSAASVAVAPPSPSEPAQTHREPVASTETLQQQAAKPVAETASPASPGVETGRLRLNVSNGWANVIVNGELRGTTPPLRTLTLPVGRYTVELRNPAAPPVVRTVEIQAGKSVSIHHAF
ncbi:MAG: protein kinase [Casimicrobiaceae bacterium]|nr:protein kinase [Casimicrobiaceae bacterium]